MNTLASLGINNGYEYGAFAPNKAITRALIGPIPA
ncbi:S-layer homology domain-containing protein [Paenibacillus sedimenti]|uniref:S-layer homology domain-containing protein n=1 Tax=Paenibacillus sedimenti TaxID=2770274 RepID=A0A926QM66_9BACL|nr:S-layer homology domain-containing protein [Paenibacillus sedimenti]